MFFTRGKNEAAYLEWRIRLFSIGGGLGIGGVWLEEPWLIYAALTVLILGVGLRFGAQRRAQDTDETDKDSEPGEAVEGTSDDDS